MMHKYSELILGYISAFLIITFFGVLFCFDLFSCFFETRFPSPGCPGTHLADQADSELTEIYLPLSPKCWELKAWVPLPDLDHNLLKYKIF